MKYLQNKKETFNRPKQGDAYFKIQIHSSKKNKVKELKNK